MSRCESRWATVGGPKGKKVILILSGSNVKVRLVKKAAVVIRAWREMNSSRARRISLRLFGSGH